MKKLSERLSALQSLCDKLGIENVDFHRLYVVTIYPDHITLQGYYSSTITQMIASNFDFAKTSLKESGFVKIELEILSEKFEIILT